MKKYPKKYFGKSKNTPNKRQKRPLFKIKLNPLKRNRQNGLEKKFEDILKHYGYTNFSFVGDGKLKIGGKIPDFWDGNKHLIELYGDYWHKGEDPNEKINFFKQYGFSTLVLWESEIHGDLLPVLDKIDKFIKE